MELCAFNYESFYFTCKCYHCCIIISYLSYLFTNHCILCLISALELDKGQNRTIPKDFRTKQKTEWLCSCFQMRSGAIPFSESGTESFLCVCLYFTSHALRYDRTIFSHVFAVNLAIEHLNVSTLFCSPANYNFYFRVLLSNVQLNTSMSMVHYLEQTRCTPMLCHINPEYFLSNFLIQLKHK
jgi:hypothetical protein